MCCACNGMCNHVGPHSYCVNHGGIYTPYSPPAPNVPFPAIPFGGNWTAPCTEHCWCRKVEEDEGRLSQQGPHRQCCKCFDYRAEEFLGIGVS